MCSKISELGMESTPMELSKYMDNFNNYQFKFKLSKY